MEVTENISSPPQVFEPRHEDPEFIESFRKGMKPTSCVKRGRMGKIRTGCRRTG
jgi:hypothetical protein